MCVCMYIVTHCMDLYKYNVDAVGVTQVDLLCFPFQFHRASECMYITSIPGILVLNTLQIVIYQCCHTLRTFAITFWLTAVFLLPYDCSHTFSHFCQLGCLCSWQFFLLFWPHLQHHCSFSFTTVYVILLGVRFFAATAVAYPGFCINHPT